ncbi:unnamed protein product [Schistosoma mattheei]|uniref:Uncharacterized protein n=1 Tax=Schistosoma mattheei TaxID=31246 RepID=A0AA85C3S4_9TREM|nr:unnamed protein product [Schistosoma mattheei]
MTISLNDLVNWLHITPFELSIHIVGIIFSLSIAVLWDEKILDILCTDQKEIVLWWVFLPLWCADALVSYFNLVIFFRRIHYHKVVRRSFCHHGFRPDYLPPPPCISIITLQDYLQEFFGGMNKKKSVGKDAFRFFPCLTEVLNTQTMHR